MIRGEEIILSLSPPGPLSAQNVIEATMMVMRPTATGTRLAFVLPSVRNSPIACFKRVLAPSLIRQLADHRAGDPPLPR